MKTLTTHQEKVLKFIIDFQNKNNTIPQFKLIADHIERKIPSAQAIVYTLERKGYLVRQNIYKIKKYDNHS